MVSINNFDNNNNTVSLTGVQTFSAANDIYTNLNNSVVIGKNAYQSGFRNVILGVDSSENQILLNDSVVIGFDADSGNGNNNVIIGSRVNGNNGTDGNENSVLIGNRASCTSCNVVIGSYATSYNQGSIVVGVNSSSVGINSVCVGNNAQVQGDYGFVIADRLRGGFDNTTLNTINDEHYGVYTVRVDADLLQLTNGCAIAFCDRYTDSNIKHFTSVRSDIPGFIPQWSISLENNDLVFQSSFGTSIRMVNDFIPSVLDFTATHKTCSYEKLDPGMVVVSTGKPLNTHSGIPFVEKSKRAHDCNVYGVVHDSQYDYAIGHIKFERQCIIGQIAVAVSGDGFIKTINEGLEIGVYLTTSHIPGVAMIQTYPDKYTRCSWTVAKITALDDENDDTPKSTIKNVRCTYCCT